MTQSKGPKAPTGWEILGEFPEVDPATAGEEDLDLLTEDVYQARSPGNRFVVDVGWHPEGQRDGVYTGRLVEDQDWECPLEELKTRDRGELISWIDNMMSAVNDRFGEPGAFSSESIVSVIISVAPKAQPSSIEMPPPADPNVSTVAGASRQEEIVRLAAA